MGEGKVMKLSKAATHASFTTGYISYDDYFVRSFAIHTHIVTKLRGKSHSLFNATIVHNCAEWLAFLSD
ncbi:hypothetical protein D3C72_1909390 [compost metagenome]